MAFFGKDSWLRGYFTWLIAYVLISIVLGLGVAAWDRATVLPGEPGFVYPAGQEPEPPRR